MIHSESEGRERKNAEIFKPFSRCLRLGFGSLINQRRKKKGVKSLAKAGDASNNKNIINN